MGAIFFAQWFCPCGQCYHQQVFKTITWLPLTRLQGNQPHRNSPDLPNPASGTYTSAHRNSPEPSKPSGACLTSTHQHTPELFGTFRNLPPEPRPAHALELSGTFRNLHQHRPELSGTFRNLHQHRPELSGTFRNLPTPAHTRTLEPSGTLWNLPEPSSGTCSCDSHRHTPELIWAEDPVSLRCWGKMKIYENMILNKNELL